MFQYLRLTRGFRLFTLFEIPVLLNVTAIFWLAYFAVPAIGLSLVIGVLVHEFAHALTARHFGFGRGYVVLTLFGGLFVLDDFQLYLEEMESQHRLRFAAMVGVGPLSNLLLGGLGIAMLNLLSINGQNASWLAIFSWVNIALGIVNLLPIPGLDGEKILYGLSIDRLSRKVTYSGIAMILIVLIPLDWHRSGFHLIHVYMGTGIIVALGRAWMSDEQIMGQRRMERTPVRECVVSGGCQVIGGTESLAELVTQESVQLWLMYTPTGKTLSIDRPLLLRSVKRLGGTTRSASVARKLYAEIEADKPMLEAVDLMAKSYLPSIAVLDQGVLIGSVGYPQIADIDPLIASRLRRKVRPDEQLSSD